MQTYTHTWSAKLSLVRRMARLPAVLPGSETGRPSSPGFVEPRQRLSWGSSRLSGTVDPQVHGCILGAWKSHRCWMDITWQIKCPLGPLKKAAGGSRQWAKRGTLFWRQALKTRVTIDQVAPWLVASQLGDCDNAISKHDWISTGDEATLVVFSWFERPIFRDKWTAPCQSATQIGANPFAKTLISRAQHDMQSLSIGVPQIDGFSVVEASLLAWCMQVGVAWYVMVWIGMYLFRVITNAVLKSTV